GRSLSFVAACFGLAGIALGGVGTVAHLTALVLLRGDAHLSAFTTSQLQAIAAIALNLRWHVFTIGMVFFGVQVFLAGCLIVRSTFLPHILGLLLALGGSSYVLISFANFLAP